MNQNVCKIFQHSDNCKFCCLIRSVSLFIIVQGVRHDIQNAHWFLNAILILDCCPASQRCAVCKFFIHEIHTTILTLFHLRILIMQKCAPQIFLYWTAQFRTVHELLALCCQTWNCFKKTDIVKPSVDTFRFSHAHWLTNFRQ